MSLNRGELSNMSIHVEVSRDSSVSTVTMPHTGLSGALTPREATDLSLLQKVQTGPAVHSVSFSTNAAGSFFGNSVRNVRLNNRLPPAPRLRMSGAVPPLPIRLISVYTGTSVVSSRPHATIHTVFALAFASLRRP